MEPPSYTSRQVSLVSLPNYSCTVKRQAHFLLKREFDTPTQASIWTRSWRRIEAELCGTVLILKTKGRAFKLSFLGGDVGLAKDYGKRSYVLRLRLEGRQFLLAADSLSTAMDWLDVIHAAVAISPPLEYRREPEFRSVPWRYIMKGGEGWKTKLQRKWREQIRKSSRDSTWLAPIPEDTATNDFSFETPRAPSASHDNPPSNRWSMLSTTSTNSAWTMFSNVDELQSTSSNETAALAQNVEDGAGKHPAAADSSERWARILLYDSPWKGSWYFRGGKIHLCQSPTDPSPERWL